ncbi:MAG: DnaJ domain-containing protein [Thermoplasmatota archaeon]
MVNIALVIAPVLIGVILTAGIIILIWWTRRRKRPSEEEKTPETTGEGDISESMEAASAFMVGNESLQIPEITEDPVVSEKIYQPAPAVIPDSEPFFARTDVDTGRYQGHDVEVKELPIPVEEEMDVSWVDLDVKRELKHILKELDRKNVNCYQILNIPKNSDRKEIQKAYRKLASMYHPDRGTQIGNLNPGEITDRIREINFSKEILLDPNMRALHDQMIRQKQDPDDTGSDDEGFDASMLGIFSEEVRPMEITDRKPTIAVIDDDDAKTGNIGVLFFRKWGEGSEHFSQEFLDYIVSLDDGGYLDYGEVLKGDLTDMDEISRLKKVSNFSQAANNALFEIWIRPPLYYMAVPVLSRDYVQEICDMLKDSFNVESIFFTYPRV